MPEKHAIIIAVENYLSTKVTPVKYAENDAKALAKSLEEHGYQGNNVDILLSSQATKTRLKSLFRTRFASIEKDDKCVVFYAGHGFANAGRNYITCHDTVLTDITNTSIELQYLLTKIREAKCKNITLLLDSCHSGLEIDECMRDILSDMTDNDFEKFCAESDYHVAFAACDHDESSYSSRKLKHGIWTYHIIQALSGQAKKALKRGKYLTTSSLQNYLSQEVPRTLGKTIAGNVRQTPKSWGNLSREAILADCTAIIAAKKTKSALAEMKGASLVGIDVDSVRNLSGFRKGIHNVPTYVNDTARAFICKIGKDELKELSDKLFHDLKAHLGYKRRDLDVDPDIDEGFVSIITPDFTVNASIGIDEDDPACYVLKVEVTDIKNASVLDKDGFADVFDEYFDRIIFELSNSLNIEELVDTIEDADSDETIRLHYPADLSSCELEIEGLDGTLEITPYRINLVMGEKISVQSLLSECRDLPKLLSNHGVVGLLPSS